MQVEGGAVEAQYVGDHLILLDKGSSKNCIDPDLIWIKTAQFDLMNGPNSDRT